MNTDGLLLAFIGYQELLIILAIVLVLFGARKIPELARGLGEGIRNFRTGLKEPAEPEEGDAPTKDGNQKLTGGSGQ